MRLTYIIIMMSENNLDEVYSNEVTLKEYLISKDWVLVGSKEDQTVIFIKEKKNNGRNVTRK